jgi:hypothetical protein
MKKNHPVQEVIVDSRGVHRFRKNQIVEWLFVSHPHIDMNAITRENFSDADRTQFAQLIGYSVSGVGDLSYFDRDVLRTADRRSKRLSEQK